MEQSSKYIKIAAVTLVIAIIAAAFTCGAMFSGFDTFASAEKMVTDADIQAIKDKIKSNDKKISDYQKRIDSIKDDIDDAYKKKEDYDQQINYIESNIEDTELLIQKYEALIEEKEKQISERQGDVDSEYNDFLQRLRVSYMSGTKNYLELLVSTDDLGGFLTRSENLGSLLNYEQTLMEELDKEIDDLDEMKKSLEEKKKEYKDLKSYQSKSKSNLESKIKKADSLISTLEKDAKAAEKARKAAEAAEAALDKELEQTLKKQKEQQSAYVGGKFLWPLDNSYKTITDTFGYRNSNGAYSSNHRGVDISAPRGASIKACNGGTVTTAAYNSSYGYYIVVDHGGGKATLYAHCSKLIAKKGDKVKQGQVIGQVGMTGVATGNHLHLEIRINGVAVNPFSTGLLVMNISGKIVDPYKNKLLKAYGCTLYK